jgi:PhoD related phosphatase
MGPVLYFRGAEDRAWKLSALVVIPSGSEPEPLLTGTDRAPPRLLAQRCGRALWRYDFALSREDEAASREYRIGARSWRVHLPALDGCLRIAFTACNGSEEGDKWGDTRERNAGWLELAREHAHAPFHLLLQGGDQLYADTIWQEVPPLAEWLRLPWRRRRHVPFSPEMAQAVADYYFDHYCRLWSQAELAPVLAAIPSLMMWDDHDIFDGWGSYTDEWHCSAVFRGIWGIAREHFALFQLAARSDDLPEGFFDREGGHFGWAYRIGDIGLLAPDLRSERNRKRVMGEAGRQAFTAALEGMADCRHVLLIFSVPLVNARLHALERLFAFMPGHQSWQDDLIDQWPSLAHQEEWGRLLRELIAFSARTGARLTSLSGEVHLAAMGLIEGGGVRIPQLTSSGIVHPPPPATLVAGLEWAAARTMRAAPGIAAKLLPLPGLGKRFLRARNWLALELPPAGGLHATWHAEGDPARISTAAHEGAAHA